MMEDLRALRALDDLVPAHPAPGQPDGIAVRFTNDPERDRRLPVSFLDWGLAPAPSEEDARAEWPEHRVVYDPAAGGWLPALGGLCAFHGLDVEEAMGKAREWSLGGLYDYVIVGPARLVDVVHDGDVVDYDWDNVIIIENPF